MDTQLANTVYLTCLSLLLIFTNTNAENGDQTQNAPVIINSYGSCGDSSLEQRVTVLEETVARHERLLQGTGGNSAQDLYDGLRDCSEIPGSDEDISGVYQIRPQGTAAAFPVYCKYMDNTLWTVIQHRADGSTSFTRDWASYRQGFGDLNLNFWLGLEHIHHITRQQQYKLRIELTDWLNVTLYAEYEQFNIQNEADGYRLFYDRHSGTVADSLGSYHWGMRFSTFDQDNDESSDEHCASLHGGGWWYRDCDHANLNGFYRDEPNMPQDEPTDTGIEWDEWQTMYSFKVTTMSIAPAFTDTFRN